ncbi:glycosyltransferase [Rhodopirellula sallentina]|uniref:Glycosyl transferase family 2 n=1 Tax=Rhodopirellula sallentina SM41 TaxID=1263870 RepID=M5ULM0_9BACT|nr:glycosyltransferase [Rhodopirellula sallentina]EMI56918.1 glycosyl transferase family 2 [Rhodopirellula sallentina SM41]
MKLSVIIPCLNEESFIGDCIRSVKQDSSEAYDVEIIVVDAGSTDQTVAIARSLGVRVVQHARSTIAAQRNAGVTASGGDVVAFLDADCTVAPGWTQSGMDLFLDHEVVGGGCPPSVPLDGTTWVQRGWSFLKRKKRPKRMAVRWIPSANVWVRRTAFEEVGGFNEELETCEDADLGFRISSLGPMVSDPKIQVYHHREPENLLEFFKKEIWHGKHSFSGIRSGRWTLAEVPSLVAPIYFFAGVSCIVIALVDCFRRSQVTPFFGFSVLVTIALPVAYTIRAILAKGNLVRSPQYFLIYLTYFAARSTAMLVSLLSFFR